MTFSFKGIQMELLRDVIMILLAVGIMRWVERRQRHYVDSWPLNWTLNIFCVAIIMIFASLFVNDLLSYKL